MNAANILLTHFSARYPKIPPASELFKDDGPTLALAFDHARIRIGDMYKFSKYLPALEQCIGDVEEAAPEDVIE